MNQAKQWRRKMRSRRTTEDIVVDSFVYSSLFGLCVLTILPFLQVLTISVSPPHVVSKDGLHLLPLGGLDWAGYQRVFQYGLLWQGYLNTIWRVVLGVSINLALLLLGAYPLSKEHLPHRRLLTTMIIFTMYFSGGLIPSYLLVRSLGIANSVWAMVLPPAVSAFTLIVVRNFMKAIPQSLEESARMDGASEFRILAQIVAPLSLPIIATVGLWAVIFHWNEWFSCMIYINNENGYVLQLVLRRILLEGQQMESSAGDVIYVNTETMKMAALMVSIVPILVVYPFLQKYFVKGTMIGSVKG